MKKSVVAILAVAIIGTLGVYTRNHKNQSDTAVQGANTAATTATPTNTTSQMANSPSSASTPSTSGTYKDGTYTGSSQDTVYGTVQVAAVISGGKITDIKFLQMPGPEGHSKEVTAFAESPLKQSTLAKQSASIDFVSGATQTSEGYQQSLQSALDQAA